MRFAGQVLARYPGDKPDPKVEKILRSKEPLNVGDLDILEKEIERLDAILDLLGDGDDDIAGNIVNDLDRIGDYLRKSAKLAEQNESGLRLVKAVLAKFKVDMSKKKEVLKTILPRTDDYLQLYVTDHGVEVNDSGDLSEWDEDDVLEVLDEYLQQEAQVTVRDDGLIEFWKKNSLTERVVGNLPVIVWHYTSSALLPKIKKEGLDPEAPTVNEHMNSGAGVYVTTEQTGPVIQGYMRKATSVYGGRGVAIGVKTTLQELEIDPDDEDLRSGQFQFVLGPVPAKDLVFE